MSAQTFRLALRHKESCCFDEPNWEVTARNKTEARREIRRLWRQENGYHYCRFTDFKIVWKTEGNPGGLVDLHIFP